MADFNNGLAVTGTLSATGALTTAGIKEDASGNLGLGVTPSAWIGAKAYEFGGGNYVASNGANGLYLGNNNYYNGSNWVYKATAEASRYLQALGAHTWYIAPSGTAGNPISWTQAMTLDASGHLLVGTTSNTNNCMTVIKSNVTGQLMELQNFSDAGYGLYFKNASGAGVGAVTWNATTTTYATSSDARLKENIVDAAPASTLIDAIQVRSFDWKTDGSHQRFGMVAQELVTVYPEAVKQSEDVDEMMAVDYSKLVPLLVKEVQSLRARVAQLEGI